MLFFGNLYNINHLILEQTIAAIIVHHKEAKYYSVGASRVVQLMR